GAGTHSPRSRARRASTAAGRRCGRPTAAGSPTRTGSTSARRWPCPA
ncbi:MAG: hypothetical protein AVDCRST_MAG57-1693, partial [uncultured Blastococcus sp.]